MFLKKDNINFSSENDFFTLNDKKIAFSDVKSIFFQGTAHYTNSVYEKTDIDTTLILHNDEKLKLRAITRDMKEYKMLLDLTESIESYRYKKLQVEYLNNNYFVFDMIHDDYKLVFEDKKLFIRFNKQRRPSSDDYEVKIIKQDKSTLYIQGIYEEEISSLNIISDRQLFINLSQKIVEYITAYETQIKKFKSNSKLYKYFFILFIPFALNGLSGMWFNTSFFRHTEPIKTLSLVSGMILGIWLLTAPMYYVVSKLNTRKLQRESDFLAGRKSSIKEIDINFENIILIALVAGLMYLIYKQVT